MVESSSEPSASFEASRPTEPVGSQECRGLYVHVPFCSSLCAYCDFASELYTEEGATRYLKALTLELATVCPTGLRPETVFFGGGTPSALRPGQIETLFRILSQKVSLGNVREMTFECNPDSAGPEKLRLLRSLGVNRVSFGAQSFDARLLKVLGRGHSPEAVVKSVAWAREAGFDNVGLDLILGAPGQTADDLERDLARATGLGAEHVSAYGLILEEGTPLAEAVERGELAEAPEDLQGRMYSTACERIEAAGLMQYEVSNFARPGFECRHNAACWRREAYLGLGPAAASFVGGERRTNCRELDGYCRRLEDGRSPADIRETLAGPAAAREELVLRLRMCEGADLDDLERRTGLDVRAAHLERIRQWASLGLVRYDGRRLSLTRDGFRVSSSILSELV